MHGSITDRIAMRNCEKEVVWTIGPGSFFKHSEELESGLHSLSIQRLDALLYTSDGIGTKFHESEEEFHQSPIHLLTVPPHTYSDFEMFVPDHKRDFYIIYISASTQKSEISKEVNLGS
ncbi:uncharacterized protein LOC123310837 [Coccinella septempunctata]|uniref:uncharacterized protein LOC123310837 n=1 Tax=Coccinella septempunctata TaxID=41139 RepID=UPI001D07436F|nr:uncharacterized protein LOC123310837 [Coccinella septempunctata]